MRAVVKAREVAKALNKTNGEAPSRDVGKEKNQKEATGNAEAHKSHSDSDLEVEAQVLRPHWRAGS